MNGLPEPVENWDLGGLFRGAGSLAKMLGPLLPQPPNPLAELQARILAVELSKKLKDGMLPYAVAPWAVCAPSSRSDHLILGARGAGKTAFAALLGQTLRQALDVPCLAVGWPEPIAEALGFRSLRATASSLTNSQDCILLLDEARLRIKDDDLWELYALARQRNVSIVYTTQTLAALPRDVLRLEAQLWARRLDPLAARFEREEVTDLAAQAIAIQSAVNFTPARPSLVCRLTAPVVVTETPLPTNWTEESSTLWRRK